MTSAELFEQYRPMAIRLAMKYPPDVADEALSILGEFVCTDLALRSMQAGVSVSTFIYRHLQWRLADLARGNHRKRMHSATDLQSIIPPRSRVTWLDRFRDLGEDACMVLHIICQTPRELEGLLVHKRPAQSRQAIREYLVGRLGWSLDRVETVWKEMTACV